MASVGIPLNIELVQPEYSPVSLWNSCTSWEVPKKLTMSPWVIVLLSKQTGLKYIKVIRYMAAMAPIWGNALKNKDFQFMFFMIEVMWFRVKL